MRSAIAASAVLCGFLFISAASSDETKVVDAAVKGVVTFRGKPAVGRVFFHLKGGQFVGCRLNDEGKFAIDRVPTGQYPITVEGDDLPKKYAEEKVSPLRIEVREGKNEFSIELL